MSDLFDPLRDLENLSVQPMPAADVRRRGDRLRRRRRTVQALAGAAAVAVVATGTALLVGSPDDAHEPLQPIDTPTQPVESPTRAVEPPDGGWLTDIPATFGLARDYPEADAESTRKGPARGVAPFTDFPIESCDAVGYPATTPADSLGARYDGLEDYRARELTVYPDATTAAAVVARLVDTWQACPTTTLPDPPFQLTTAVTRTDFGDESWTVVEGAPQFPSLQVFTVVRVGNALLVNRVSNEAMLDRADAVVAEQEAAMVPLVADMCIFGSEPCSSGEPYGNGVLGPDGYRELRLGMSAAQVTATGEANAFPGSPHDGWKEGCFVLERVGSALDDDGRVSPDQGLEQIIASPDMRTPNGITIGSTLEQVQQSFARLVGTPDYMTAQVSDTARYVLVFTDRRVTSLSLELNVQDCQR